MAFCTVVSTLLKHLVIGLLDGVAVVAIFHDGGSAGHPPIMAFLNAAYGPDLKARIPPVMKPDITAFHGSSVCL